jgi:3-deoxy-7-phosphoheptulonate synthase
VSEKLKKRPALVSVHDCDTLRQHIARAAKGEAFILQIGDCAETFAEVSAALVAEKIEFYRKAADCLQTLLGVEVIILGRMAGQFAKPRSNPYEQQSDETRLSYRGDMVHSWHDRSPDPERMLTAYQKSAEVLSHMHDLCAGEPGRWFSSHEALQLEYDSAINLRSDRNKPYGGSAHFLWLGERTRSADSAHVEYLRGIENPIGVKVGPGFDEQEMVQVIKRLNPQGVAGRLTLIPRFGVQQVVAELGRLISLLQKHQLSSPDSLQWFLDPMHGNTLSLPSGQKTRKIRDICEEIGFAVEVAALQGIRFSGLHLEASSDEVTECLGAGVEAADLQRNYSSWVDPRLNPNQCLQVILSSSQSLSKFHPRMHPAERSEGSALFC